MNFRLRAKFFVSQDKLSKISPKFRKFAKFYFEKVFKINLQILTSKDELIFLTSYRQVVLTPYCETAFSVISKTEKIIKYS